MKILENKKNILILFVIILFIIVFVFLLPGKPPEKNIPSEIALDAANPEASETDFEKKPTHIEGTPELIDSQLCEKASFEINNCNFDEEIQLAEIEITNTGEIDLNWAIFSFTAEKNIETVNSVEFFKKGTKKTIGLNIAEQPSTVEASPWQCPNQKFTAECA